MPIGKDLSCTNLEMNRKETILSLAGDLKNFLKDAMCQEETQKCLQGIQWRGKRWLSRLLVSTQFCEPSSDLFVRARETSAMSIPKILCESNEVWTITQMTETIWSQRLII